MVVRASKKKFRPFTPEIYRCSCYSPDQCLREDDLVFFLLDVLDHLDLARFYTPGLNGALQVKPESQFVCSGMF